MVHAAAGLAAGKASLTETPDHSPGTMVNHGTEGDTPVGTLDELLGHDVCGLKLDAEGSEVHILLGARCA